MLALIPRLGSLSPPLELCENSYSRVTAEDGPAPNWKANPSCSVKLILVLWEVSRRWNRVTPKLTVARDGGAAPDGDVVAAGSGHGPAEILRLGYLFASRDLASQLELW